MGAPYRTRDDEQRSTGRRLAWRWYALFFVVAGLVRLRAGANDLWLDEIWTLSHLDQVSSLSEIFTRFHHDNNHFLNSIWMYLIGDQDHPLIYRAPSIVAGALAALVAGLIARGRGRTEELTAMLLVSFSYLLVHYSSESRGYGAVLLFSLSGFYALRRFHETRSWMWALAFGLSVVGGMLSHLLVVQFYLAAIYWSFAVLSTTSRSWRETLAEMARCHAIPVLFGGALYVVSIRHLDSGAGPTCHQLDLILHTEGFFVGGPIAGYGAWISLALVVTSVACGLWILRRDRQPEWKFYAFAMLAFPILRIFVLPPAFMFARYLLVVMVFFLILSAFVLAGISRQGRWGRWIYCVAIALFVAGNYRYMHDLFENGRGQ